jgi:hypothetical protein
VAYSKRPFGGAQHALRYLGQYTHRVAISNHRLVALADGNVTFRWRDSAHKNKKRLMTLPVGEFLRRFLLHVLPPGFVRIRHFGFLAHRRRRASLPLCLQLLAESGRIPKAPEAEEGTVRLHGPFGLVRNAAARWCSSNGSAISSFDCGPHRFRSPINHDTIFLITAPALTPTPIPHVCLRCPS